MKLSGDKNRRIDPSDCKTVKAAVEKFGSIDILVNNAGVGFHHLFVDTTLEDWNRVIGINLTVAFLLRGDSRND